MAENTVCISQQQTKPIKIIKWNVREGNTISIGRVILLYDFSEADKREQRRLKSTQAGTVKQIVAQEGAIVQPGDVLIKIEPCSHPTIMNDMCAECGADLRKEDLKTTASVPMVHAIPDLKVSEEMAQKLGKADNERLLRDRKLVLLVDLDQTLIHTTNDNIPPNIKDVYHFQLYGPSSPWYHTRLRPGTHKFLEDISSLFELHICTFGARNYAHMIAMFLDGEQKFFSNRILSRDECFDPTSKKANLKALFPCGDNIVCIIDDREDVWSHATNLIHVKPYHFFQHTGDINAPPGLDKHENDNTSSGVDLTKIKTSNGIGTAEPSVEQNCTEEITEINKENDVKSNENTEEDEDKSKNTSTDNLEENNTKVDAEEQPKITAKIAEEDQIDDNAKSENHEAENSNENAVITVEPSKKENNIEMEEPKKDLLIKEDNEKNNLKENNNVTTEATTEEVLETLEKKETIPTQENGNSTSPKDENSSLNNQITNNNTPNNSQENLIEIEDPDDYLLYLECVLKRIHKAFYDEFDNMESGEVPDLKKVIPDVKSQVLKSAKLVFSGLVPTHIKLEQSKAYLVAKSMGAKVTQELEEDSTHLVAVRPGTAKVNAGRRKKNLKIVTPDWLWCCAERWEHVSEKIFPLNNKGSKNRHPPPHCSSPEHTTNYPVHRNPAKRIRSPSGRFMDTINPLMSFSSADIADMDKEVEDILDDESDSSDEEKPPEKPPTPTIAPPEQDSNSSSSSIESLTAEFPKGYKRSRDEMEESNLEDFNNVVEEDESPSIKFRRGEALEDELDIGEEDSQESTGSMDPPDEVDDGEWNMMGAALEREFLSNE